MPESKKPRSSRSSSRSSSKSNRSSKKPTSIWAVLFALVVLAIGYLANQGYIDAGWFRDLSTSSSGSTTPSPQTAPPTTGEQGSSSGSIQVYFTTPSLVYPDKPDERTPPPFEQALIADIDAAKQSVDAATFEYNLTSVGEALVRAKKRGVHVRLALDEENLEKPEMAAWAGMVEDAGIPIAWEQTDAFLHSKFVVIDNAIVWMGSWNITNNDTYRNNNNLLRFTVPAIVENYAAEFSQMNDGVFGNKKESLAPSPQVTADGVPIENYFSPQDGVEQHVLDRLNNAQHRIRFLAFSYTSDPIADAMIAKHRAGVQVQGVFENRNAGGTGAEYDRLKDAGIDVLVDGNCYTMHHKVIIVDDATVITGSYNFTRRAEETNDENLVILDNPSLAAQFVEEFNRVYSQAQNPQQCGS